MILVNLFLVFAKIGLFAIGGAYSFLPLMQKEIVGKYHWLTEQELLDVSGMVRIFPGAISVKYATYTGYKIAGVPGAILANLGNLLGPAILIVFMSMLYARYKDLAGVKKAFNAIQLVAFSMIIAVAFQLINVKQLTQLRNLLIVIVSFVLFMHAKIHPALIIISAGIVGFFLGR